VGTLAATDPDAGDVLTFSVVNDARFEAVNGQLRLKSGIALTQPGQVVVDVGVTDAGGLALTRSFAVVAQPVAQQSDVTALVSVTYSGTASHRTTKQTSFYGTLTNTSSQPIGGPIWLAFSGLSPST